MQRKRFWMSALAFALIALTAWVWVFDQERAARVEPSNKGSSVWDGWFRTGHQGAWPPTAPLQSEGKAADAAKSERSPIDSVRPPVFRVNDHGQLIIDAQTRADVERLYALYANDGGQEKLAERSAKLPEAAKLELRDLYQHWSQYAQAVMQSLRPDTSADPLEEAKRQLVGLRLLRLQYFGADQAHAMFAEEDEMAEDLLHRVEANKNPALSFEEKVHQAQEDISAGDSEAKPAKVRGRQ